tara:strand:- start:3534 stop:3872 length:339 start_codon:yes stop_codon:yes gene_type:complete
MELTKRQINNHLKKKLIRITDTTYLRGCVVRVERVRICSYNNEVDVRIYGEVLSSLGEWKPLSEYPPRKLRQFLRSPHRKVSDEVSLWVDMWIGGCGVELKNITLVNNEDDV